MGPMQFAEACRRERDALIVTYSDDSAGTEVASLLRSACLNADQRAIVMDALSTALTDAFYTVLLALDGAASLGGDQHAYSLRDSEGTPVNGDGNLEAAAWEAFHAN